MDDSSLFEKSHVFVYFVAFPYRGPDSYTPADPWKSDTKVILSRKTIDNRPISLRKSNQ